ncbi:E3 ubiquitin-protein ligase ATL6-like [Apium graveolens]|uniref:E3 ubiquitin-protein ligase ATL6-like n=1 Tax=Apium graveolens TaxID=4045 RepID=UPI003D7A4D25
MSTPLILTLLLMFLVQSVYSQPPSPIGPEYPYAKFSPSMAIIIAVLVTALFFMGFFSIYLRRCADTTTGGSMRPALSLRRRAAAPRGLSEEVITTFPTMAYSEVKDLKIGKGALECAVCLNEFEDDETLRLLPKCDHVFHPECIDLWLASHVTCPVCRADLVPKPLDPDDLLPPSETENVVDRENGDEIEVVVVDQVDVNLQEPVVSKIMNRTGSLRSNRPPRSGSVRSRIFGFGNKFPRSHSTGHSLVQLGENVDRYTLRLPEEVRKEIIRRALLNRTGSCAEPGSRKGHQPGEGSSRGKSYRRLGSLENVVKSDRWVFSKMPSFLSRALSVRTPRGAGEGSTSVTTKSSEKGDQAGLVANDSAKFPV